MQYIYIYIYDGIKACNIYMMENSFPSIEISNITKIIDFILTHNYFEFNDESMMFVFIQFVNPHKLMDRQREQRCPHICKHIYVKLRKNIY